MSKVNAIVGPDTILTDDSGVVRILGTHIPLGTKQEWACREYLKKKIGSAFQESVDLTLTQDAAQTTSKLIDNEDGNANLLRHIAIGAGADQLSELMVAAGLCKKYDLQGGSGYTAADLENNSTLDTNESAALSATRIIHNATYGGLFSTPVPQHGIYSPSAGNYRRIYVDLTNGGNSVITHLLSLLTGTEDLVTTLTELEGSYTSIAVNGEGFRVPHPSSPTCDFLILLGAADGNGITYDFSTDFAWVANSLTQLAAKQDWGVIGSNDDTIGSYSANDRVYSRYSVAFGFPSGAINEDADTILAWIRQERIGSQLPTVASTVGPSRTLYPSIPAQRRDPELGAIPAPRNPLDWVPQRSAIRELGLNRKIYYSGSDCLVFMNGQFLDQASAIAHSISVSTKPQFDYHRIHPKFFSRGKVAIRGVIRFPIVTPNLIASIVRLSKPQGHFEARDFVVKSFAALPETIIRIRELYTKALEDSNTVDLNAAIDYYNEFNRTQQNSLVPHQRLYKTSDRNRNSNSPMPQDFGHAPGLSFRQDSGFLEEKAESVAIFMGASDFINFDNTIREPMFVTNYEDVWFTDISTGFSPDSQTVEAQVNFVARQYKEFEYNNYDEEESRRRLVTPGEAWRRKIITDSSGGKDTGNPGRFPLAPQASGISSLGNPYDLNNLERGWTTMTLNDGGDLGGTAAGLINDNKARYERTAQMLESLFKGSDQVGSTAPSFTIPWYVVGLIHYRETGSIFDGSAEFAKTIIDGTALSAEAALHNNPLNFSAAEAWEGDAAHHFHDRHLHGGRYNLLAGSQLDAGWTAQKILQFTHAWNGFGYWDEDTGINSPYLWGYTSHHTTGKYASDGNYSSTATEAQPGTANMLKRLIQLTHISDPGI